MCRKKFNCVANAFASGVGNVARGIAEVVKGRADIEPGKAVICPCALFLWAFVDHDFTAGWGQWCLLEVKHTPQLCVG